MSKTDLDIQVPKKRNGTKQILTPNPQNTKSLLKKSNTDKILINKNGTSGSTKKKKKKKISTDDFTFGGVLGSGAFAKVLYAKKKTNGKEYAIKVVEKSWIHKQHKQNSILAEKNALLQLGGHPGIIGLHYCFRDDFWLYFVLELASGGTLSSLIEKKGKLSLKLTRFFAAECILALEHFFDKEIIHRDLKPENLLITEKGHIKITDFGTCKFVSEAAKQREKEKKEMKDKKAKEEEEGSDNSTKSPNSDSDDDIPEPKRKNSFVGTADFVTPEVLNNKELDYTVDLWALGCIIYQCLVGKPPFRSEVAYHTFKKILARDFFYPENFEDMAARDLIDRLLMLNPSSRIGYGGKKGWDELKKHRFFKGIDWDNIWSSTPPEVPEELIIDGELKTVDIKDWVEEPEEKIELQLKSKKNENNSQWHQFIRPDEEIMYQGLVSKKKNYLFGKTRQLILTNEPRFVYIDVSKMQKKGEILWSPTLWAEAKNEKLFWIHTPNRRYNMQALSHSAKGWVEIINMTRNLYWEKNKKKTKENK